MRFFLILLFPILLFAHKVNLFLDLKDDNLYINSYFANAKPCLNCKFKIEKYDKIIFEGFLDENGEYNYKTSLNNLKVTIDAGSGHIVKKEIETVKIEQKEDKNDNTNLALIEENRALKHKIEVLEEQLNYFEIFKVLFGVLLIALIFLFIKRVKA